MSNRQKIYIGLALSAGICTGVGLFLYLRHRRQISGGTKPGSIHRSVTPASIISSIKHRRDPQHADITSTIEDDQSNSDSVRIQSGNTTIDLTLPDANTPLTAHQAIILTGYLDQKDEGILQSVLTTIANLGTFAENQIQLTNAGCIERLRELLFSNDNDSTRCKILLALNNLALNDYSITHYVNFVSAVIELCRTTPSNSLVRLYGLKLLINMSVLEYLHEEFVKHLPELDLLIDSTWPSHDEALSAGKILVNLSTNKANTENLLKLTSVQLKTIVSQCTSAKKSNDEDQSIQLEDVFLRYLTFYCNVSEKIIDDCKQDPSGCKAYLTDPVPHSQNSLYFELFDHDKQMAAKTLLRSHYSSVNVNSQIKRLRQGLDTLRQIQFESSVSNVHQEFDEIDSFTEASTPKKSTTTTTNNHQSDPVDDKSSLNDLGQVVNDQFDEDDDETIHAEQSSPSDQSLASYQSAISTNDNNPFASPEKSFPTENC